MVSPIVVVILVIFLVIFLTISGFIAATVSRRIVAKRRYERLDQARKVLREKVKLVLESPNPDLDEILVRPQDWIRWQALEDVLMDHIAKAEYREKVKAIFRELGYVSYYENRLRRRSVIERATAIDRLGGMRSEASMEHLVRMLDSRHPELVAGAVRAITRIRSAEGLRAILTRLPELQRQNLIAQKLVDAQLTKFGREGVPVLLEYARTDPPPEILASVLETISNFEAPEAFPDVLGALGHEHPEVRAKAVKAFGKVDPPRARDHRERLLPLLEDPVWFVRLQAARAAGSMGYTEAAARVGLLLLDQKWQVRSAAASALVALGEIAVEVFWHTLRQNDRYASESICEEIGKTELIRRLIDNLATPGTEGYVRSREILETMVSLNFRAQIEEALETDPRPGVRAELARILTGPEVPETGEAPSPATQP